MGSPVSSTLNMKDANTMKVSQKKEKTIFKLKILKHNKDRARKLFTEAALHVLKYIFI